MTKFIDPIILYGEGGENQNEILFSPAYMFRPRFLILF